MDLSVLSKRIETGPIATHFNSAYAQTIPLLLDFNHIPMTGRVVMGKLWQTYIIKITQAILDRINEMEQQEVSMYAKSNKNKWGNNNNGLLGSKKEKISLPRQHYEAETEKGNHFLNAINLPKKRN